MSLEEEIAIYQFGQGVRSADDLSNYVGQLDDFAKMSWLENFSSMLSRLHLTNYELDQTIAEYSSEVSLPPTLVHYVNRLRKGSWGHLSVPDMEKYLMLLLQLFKIGYQRQLALEKEYPTGWQYQDLSNDEAVRHIHETYEALVDNVYADPSFRSEFASLAKLWHERYTEDKVKFQVQEPDPAPQTKFDFISYDEVITLAVNLYSNTSISPMYKLRHSVEQALLKMHHLQPQQASRLIMAVIERHLKETYNTGLY
jgi:hypothetical protein